VARERERERNRDSLSLSLSLSLSAAKKARGTHGMFIGPDKKAVLFCFLSTDANVVWVCRNSLAGVAVS